MGGTKRVITTVNGTRFPVMSKVIALAFFVGALPFFNFASAYAGETSGQEAAEDEQRPESRVEWLWGDYKKPVRFTYSAQARIQTAYLWRGFYAGGANIQGSATVGYGGLYIGTWWNIGVTDWTFNTFLPEMDWSIGFNRWGVDVYMLWVHNFDCKLFDFANYTDHGNRLELNVRYTLSEKVPLTIGWATRIAAADGYINEKGELVRAYSSWLEISYTQRLPYGMSLYGSVGMTPWKSGYTGFKGGFAVTNTEVRLRKDWSVSDHCGLMLQGQLAINPYALSEDKSSAEWHPYSPGSQAINANIAFGVYLK